MFEWSGRTIEYYRAQIRQHLGFRECTVEDAGALQGLLAEHFARADPRPEVVREGCSTAAGCRGSSRRRRRIERIVRAAVRGAHSGLCERTVARLAEETLASCLRGSSVSLRGAENPVGRDCDGISSLRDLPCFDADRRLLEPPAILRH